MKRRIAIWAAVGFVVACGWALLAFLSSPQPFLSVQRTPLLAAAFYVTCPVLAVLRHTQLYLWWAVLINTATYLVVGAAVESVRFTLKTRTVH